MQDLEKALTIAMSKISSSVSTLSIVALGQEFVPLCGVALRAICWDGGVLFIGVDPSGYSEKEKGAKEERILG